MGPEADLLAIGSNLQNKSPSKHPSTQQDSNQKLYPSVWNFSEIQKHFNLSPDQFNGFKAAIRTALQNNGAYRLSNLLIPSQQAVFTAAINNVNYSEPWIRGLKESRQKEILRQIGRGIILAERSRLKRISARRSELESSKKRQYGTGEEGEASVACKDATATSPPTRKRRSRSPIVFYTDSSDSSEEEKELQKKQSADGNAVIDDTKAMSDTSSKVEKGAIFETSKSAVPAPVHQLHDLDQAMQTTEDDNQEEDNLPLNGIHARDGNLMRDEQEPASEDDYMVLRSYRDLTPPCKDKEQGQTDLVSEGSDIPYRPLCCSLSSSPRNEESASPPPQPSPRLSKPPSISDASEKQGCHRSSSMVRFESPSPRKMASSAPPPNIRTQFAPDSRIDSLVKHNPDRNLTPATQTPTSVLFPHRTPFHRFLIRTTTTTNSLESVSLIHDLSLKSGPLGICTPTSVLDLSLRKWQNTLTEDIKYNGGTDSLTYLSKRSGISRPIFNERQWRAAISEGVEDYNDGEERLNGGRRIEICFTLHRT